MNQLSLFDNDELYVFPEELLDFREQFLTKEEADVLKNLLLCTAQWEQKTQKMYDKTVLTPRLTAWYGDSKYNKPEEHNTFTNPWTPELFSLKQKIEKEFDCRFNGVLLNLYRNQNDSVAWHRDKESRYGKRPIIASISLGQTRNFDFRKMGHNKTKYSLALPHGSLLIMKGNLQENWEHRIAKSALKMTERINLTFRLVKEM